MDAEFAATFAALKSVLAKHARRLSVKMDTPVEYALATRSPSPFPQHKRRPMDFGSVHIGKAYVSFHLMPIYMNPKLHATISPELKKRMQGKSCFNFTQVEPEQIAELKRLTAVGFEEFQTWPARFTSA